VANFGTNGLYRNNGDGTFTDVTHNSGITGRHWSTSLAWGDLDGDGNLDLYVVNYVRNEWLVCRHPNGKMGSCHPVYFEPEDDVLYRNRGDGAFDDITRAAGMESSRGRGLGVVIADLDDDGCPDVFVANDGDPNFLYHNLGNSDQGLRFVEKGLLSGTAARFDGVPQAAMGVACADLDGDGRPDLVVVHQDRPVALLRNETESAGHRLILELHGVESNRDAVGARLRVTSSNSTQVLEICGGDGFMATNERRLIVGLGSATKVDVLEVRWPAGRDDRWTDIPANSKLTLIEGHRPRIKKMDADR
jgi:hypothetical protein